MDKRQKWSIAILAIMALSVPTYYFFRWDRNNVMFSGRLASNTNVAKIEIIDQDIVFLQFNIARSGTWTILETAEKSLTGVEGDPIYSAQFTGGEQVNYVFSAKAYHTYNVVVSGILQSGTQVNLKYYLQTAFKGFIIWEILLAIVLVGLWVGSFLIKVPVPNDLAPAAVSD